MKRDCLRLDEIIEAHWAGDQMDLRKRYEHAVRRINYNDLDDWHKIRGMSEQKGPVKLVLEAMCICVGMKPEVSAHQSW